jgi:hypothetical protein
MPTNWGYSKDLMCIHSQCLSYRQKNRFSEGLSPALLRKPCVSATAQKELLGLRVKDCKVTMPFGWSREKLLKIFVENLALGDFY